MIDQTKLTHPLNPKKLKNCGVKHFEWQSDFPATASYAATGCQGRKSFNKICGGSTGCTPLLVMGSSELPLFWDTLYSQIKKMIKIFWGSFSVYNKYYIFLPFHSTRTCVTKTFEPLGKSTKANSFENSAGAQTEWMKENLHPWVRVDQAGRPLPPKH